MKHWLFISAIVWVLCSGVTKGAADEANKASLDVLKMQEVPSGFYDVQLQLAGKDQSVKLVIKGNRAAFVKTTSDKLEGLSGGFELIGNGVFLARLAGKDHRASQWWIFHTDGTATVREIPDRGEKQIARRTTEQ